MPDFHRLELVIYKKGILTSGSKCCRAEQQSKPIKMQLYQAGKIKSIMQAKAIPKMV